MTLAGCGGGGSDGQTAGEKRAALDRWVTAADAACRKSNDAIAKRGWPANLVDLDRLTVRAITEIRGASDAVRRLKQPEGSEDRVRPFLDSVKQLDPVMDELSSTHREVQARPPERPPAQGPVEPGRRRGAEQEARPAPVRGERRARLGAGRHPRAGVRPAAGDPQPARSPAREGARQPASTQRQRAPQLRPAEQPRRRRRPRITTFKPPQWARTRRQPLRRRAARARLRAGRGRRRALRGGRHPDAARGPTHGARKFYRAARSRARAQAAQGLLTAPSAPCPALAGAAAAATRGRPGRRRRPSEA